MVRKQLGMYLTLATLSGAGCTNSEFPVTTKDRSNWKAQQDERLASATDAPPPKILPATYFAAGQLLERQGRIDAAIFQYRKALVVAHDYTAAHHRLGLLLSDSGRHAEALECLQKAASLAPNSAIVRNNLGYELMLHERWDEAENELAKAAELQPGFAHARINLGMVQSKMGRFDEALATFRTVLPEADALYNLGLMYRGQRRYEDAAEAFNRVLESNPEFSAAFVQLEQLAPRLELVAWNVSNPSDSPEFQESASDSETNSETSSDTHWTSATAVVSTSRGSSMQDTGSSSDGEIGSWASIPAHEAQDNPWILMDAVSRDDGQSHRAGPHEWLSPLSDPSYAESVVPSVDLSHASSPPTLAELTAALSIVRNEAACLEEQTTEFGWSPTTSDLTPWGIVDAATTSPGDTSIPGSISTWDAWLQGGDSNDSTSPDSGHRRRTLGMSIIPESDQGAASSRDDEFVGPPEPEIEPIKWPEE